MINCKNDGCPKGKKMCCFFCEEKNECLQSCDASFVDDPGKCELADIVGSSAIELFSSKAAKAISIIQSIEVQKKQLEEDGKKMREAVKEAMEEYGITKFSNDVLEISYIKEGKRTSLDSKKLKAELPKVFDDYSKTSKVSASIRIKLKDDGNKNES